MIFRYRYQLEAFVDKIKGRQPKTWVTGDESIGNMQLIENIYVAVSLHKFLISTATNRD